ncbi:ABC-type nitrate/sulfonate/bicarbonate transport system ATPase subunit [Gracilibacillus halotolerans]|uniref:ABC-type nitrate/sulfonate/bicarbonate transport system ATPase subunit n=1 Tax=Gracilibacillus halotolerans TaxID=74386 RepID=A0A841RQN0_9BACI|nr:ABC transporter ATP-binding protein [Gracilibacillus halotolerans]MBB6513234.1 ABC-type nitrate/sulfonate/bicarbonate transport system ATPase subunit [Gracilibacillus halotolerans]
MSKLEINQLSKRFDDTAVLENVSLVIKDGEFVSLLGPSGSGKSTLFHLIGGLFAPDSGSITLDGEDITGKRGKISYMPQSPSLFPWRSVLDNVLLAQELKEKPNRDKAIEMLNKVGLSEYKESYPRELSGGMKQRAAFVRSLLSPQKAMLLDEPFSALDEFTRMEMQKWLLSIWEEAKPTVLFVTHDIEEAIFLSDRILILGDRPATIVKEISIQFSRPRVEDIRLSEEFLHIKREIYQILRSDSHD